MSESAQLEALTQIWNVMRNMSRWLLNRPGEQLDIARSVTRYKPAMETLRSSLGALLSGPDKSTFAEVPNTAANEFSFGNEQVKWLEQNGYSLIVNRYNGTLFRGEKP